MAKQTIDKTELQQRNRLETFYGKTTLGLNLSLSSDEAPT